MTSTTREMKQFSDMNIVLLPMLDHFVMDAFKVLQKKQRKATVGMFLFAIEQSLLIQSAKIACRRKALDPDLSITPESFADMAKFVMTNLPNHFPEILE